MREAITKRLLPITFVLALVLAFMVPLSAYAADKITVAVYHGSQKVANIEVDSGVPFSEQNFNQPGWLFDYADIASATNENKNLRVVKATLENRNVVVTSEASVPGVTLRYDPADPANEGKIRLHFVSEDSIAKIKYNTTEGNGIEVIGDESIPLSNKKGSTLVLVACDRSAKPSLQIDAASAANGTVKVKENRTTADRTALLYQVDLTKSLVLNSQCISRQGKVKVSAEATVDYPRDRLIPPYTNVGNRSGYTTKDDITYWKIDGWDSDFATYHNKTKQPDVLTYAAGQGKPADPNTFSTAGGEQTFNEGDTVEIYISSDKFQTKPLVPDGGLKASAGINSYRELADIWINDSYAIAAPLPTAKANNSWGPDGGRPSSFGAGASSKDNFLNWAKDFKTKATKKDWSTTVTPTVGDLAGSTITVDVVDARPYVDDKYLGDSAEIAVGAKDASGTPNRGNIYWNNVRFQYKVTITNLKSDITVKPTFYDTAEPFMMNNHSNGADLKVYYCDPDTSKYGGQGKWMKSYFTGDGLHTWSCQSNGRGVSSDAAARTAAGYFAHSLPEREMVKLTTFPFNWGGDYHVDKKLFWSLGSNYDFEAVAHNGYKNLVYRDYTAQASNGTYTRACNPSQDADKCANWLPLRAFFEDKNTGNEGTISVLLGAYASVGVTAEPHRIPAYFDFAGGTVTDQSAFITEEQSRKTDVQKNVANNPNITVPDIIPTKGQLAFGFWRLEYQDETGAWHKAGNDDAKSQISPGEKIDIRNEDLFGRLTTGNGRVKVKAIRLTAVYGQESANGPAMFKADKRLCEGSCDTGKVVEQSMLASFPAVEGLDVALDADRYLPDYIDKDGKRYALVYDVNVTNKQALLQKKLESERVAFDFVYQRGYTVTFKPAANATIDGADSNGNKLFYIPDGGTFHQSQTVAATAAKNYVFKGWKKDGDNSGTLYSTESIYQTPVTADVTYVAVVEEDRSTQPTLSLSNTATDANTQGTGTTVASGTAVPGSEIVLTWTDKDGQQQTKTVTADASTGAYTVDLGANIPKDAQVSVTAKQDNHQLPSNPVTATVTPDTSKMNQAITDGKALLPADTSTLQAPEQALADAIKAAEDLLKSGATPTQAEIDAATAKIKAEAEKVRAWLDEVDAAKSVLSILKDNNPTASVVAGTEVTVKVDLKDHRGNKYTGTKAPTELKVNLPGLGEVTLAKQKDGSYSVAATPKQAVASTDATVTTAGYTTTPAVKFAVTAADPANKLVDDQGQPTQNNASTVSLSPAPATAGEPVTGAVVLKDKYGNLVNPTTNPTVTVGGKEVALTPVPGKPGEYTFTYTPTKHTEANAPLDVVVKVGQDTVANNTLTVKQQIPDSVEFTNAPTAGVVGTAIPEGSKPGESGTFIAKKNGQPVAEGTEVYVKVPGKTDPVKVVAGPGGVCQIPGFTPDTKGTQKIEIFPVDANGDRQTTPIGSSNVEVDRATSSDPVITSVGSVAANPDRPSDPHGTTVTGTGTPGATVTVTVPTADGSTKTVTGTVEADGNFTIALGEDVAEGAQISLTQEDKATDKKPSAAVTSPVTVDRSKLSAAQQEANAITLPDPAKTPEEKALKAALDAAKAIAENGTKKPTQKDIDDATAALKEAIKNYQNSYDPTTSTVALTGKDGSPITEVVAGEEVNITVDLKNHAGGALTPGPSTIKVNVPGVADPVELTCTKGVCTGKAAPTTAGTGNVTLATPDYQASTLEKPLTVKPAGAAQAAITDDTPKTGVAGDEIQGGKVKITDKYGNPVAPGTTVYAKLPGKDELVPVVVGSDGSAAIPAYTPPAAGTSTVSFFAEKDDTKPAIGSYEVNVDKATSVAPTNVQVTNTPVDPDNAKAPHGSVVTGDTTAPNGTTVIVSYPNPEDPNGAPIVKTFPDGVKDGKINVNLGDGIPGGTQLTVTLQEPDKYPSDHGKTDGSGSSVVTVASDKSALNTALTNAGAPIATPNPLHPEEQALNDAIAEAERIKNDPKATQAQIDAATKALNDAKTAYDKVYSPQLSTLKVLNPQDDSEIGTIVAGNPIKVVFTPKNNKGETPENLPPTMQVRVPGVKDLVTLTLDPKTGTYSNDNIVPQTVSSGDSAKLAIEDAKFPAEAGDGNNPALEVTPAAPAGVEFVNLPTGAISEQAVSGVEIRVTDEFGNRAPAGSKVFVKLPGEENPREIQVGANGIATIPDFTPVVNAKGNVDIIAYPVGSDGLADTKKEIGKDSFLVDMATTPAPTDLVLTNTARDPEHPDTTPGGTVLTGHSTAKPGSTVTVEIPNPADPSGAPITKTGVVGDDGNFSIDLGTDLPKGTTPKVTVSQEGKYPSSAVDQDKTGTKLSVSPDTTQADAALANANDVPANPQTDIERAYQKAKEDLEKAKANPTITQKELDDLTDALRKAKDNYDNVYNPANSSITLTDKSGQPLTKVTAGEPVKIAVDLKNNANTALNPKPQTITVSVPGVTGDVTLTLDPDTGLYVAEVTPEGAVPAGDSAKVQITTPGYTGPEANLSVDPASSSKVELTIPKPEGGFVSDQPITGGTVKVTDRFGNPVKEGTKAWVALPGNTDPVEVTVGKDGIANLPEFTPVTKEHKDLPITVYAPNADGTGADTTQKLGESTINVDMATTPAPDQITLTATARDPENPETTPGGVVLKGHSTAAAGSEVTVTITTPDGKNIVKTGVVGPDGNFTVDLGTDIPQGSKPSVTVTEAGKYPSTGTATDDNNAALLVPVDKQQAEKTLQDNPKLTDTAATPTPGEKAYEQARKALEEALKKEDVTQKELDDATAALRDAKAALDTERTFNADNSEIVISYGDSDKVGESTENVKKEHLVNLEVKLRDNAGNILHTSPDTITVKVPGVADPVVLTKDPATGTFKGVAKPMTPTTGTNDDNKLVITTPEFAAVTAGTLNVNEWNQASAPENVKISLSRDSVEPGPGETDSKRNYVVSGTGVPGAKVTLRDANGQPVLDADGKEITATVGQDGYFELPIPAGKEEGTQFKVSQLLEETLESSAVETGNALDTVPPTKVELSGAVKDSKEITLTPVGDGKFVAGDTITVTLPDGSKLTHKITPEEAEAGKIKLLLPKPLDSGENINVSISDGINATASDTYKVPERTPEPTNVHITRDPVNKPQGENGERLSYLSGNGVPGATVTLVDANGNVVLDKEGHPVTVVVSNDGTFNLPLPYDIKDGDSFGVFQEVNGKSTSLTSQAANYVDLTDPHNLETKQPSASDNTLQIKVPNDDTTKIHVVFPDGSEIVIEKIIGENGQAYWAVNGEKINIVNGYLQLPVRLPGNGTINIYAEDPMGNLSKVSSVDIIPAPKADPLALTGTNGLELVMISLMLVASGSVMLYLWARRKREEENV